MEEIPRLREIECEAAALFPAADLPDALARPASADELLAGIRNGLLWVACDAKDSVVGFLLGEVHDHCLHIAEMDVLPRFGRAGFGTALLLHAVAAARSRSLSFVTLTTFEHLPWNAPFYAKNGFCQVTGPGQFPHLARALKDEARRGLRNRVAMVRNAA